MSSPPVLSDAHFSHAGTLYACVRACSSCITAFIFDNILRPEHKFSMVTIQTATLSGGVRPALTRPYPA